VTDSILARVTSAISFSLDDPRERELRAVIQGVLLASRAEGTFRNYLLAWDKFEEWCADRLPKRCALPAAPDTVLTYLAEVFDGCRRTGKGYAVIKTASAAIYAVHDLAGVAQNPTKALFVKQFRKGVKRIMGVATLNRKEPFTLEMVLALAEIYAGPAAPATQVMLVGLIILAYAGGFRFCEATRVKVRDLVFHEGYMTVFVAFRKNDQYRDTDTVPIAMGGTAACPVNMLKRIIAMDQLAGDQFLFRDFDGFRAEARKYDVPRSGSQIKYNQAHYHCLKFLAKVLGITHAECKKLYGMHSARSGAASAAVSNGYEDRRDLLCCQMGWKDPRSAARYVKASVSVRLGVSRAVGL
jgi:integrase